MPRLSEAMKDVISCEKLRGLAHTDRSVDIRMGQPSMLKTCYPIRRRTRRTETSKYPEEKKTKVIPLVVASESGGAQTLFVTANKGL